MDKSKAIELLGGSIQAAADAIGVTYKAVHKWPDVLTDRVADRVEAAVARMSKQRVKANRKPEPKNKQPAI